MQVPASPGWINVHRGVQTTSGKQATGANHGKPNPQGPLATRQAAITMPQVRGHTGVSPTTRKPTSPGWINVHSGAHTTPGKQEMHLTVRKEIDRGHTKLQDVHPQPEGLKPEVLQARTTGEGSSHSHGADAAGNGRAPTSDCERPDPGTTRS